MPTLPHELKRSHYFFVSQYFTIIQVTMVEKMTNDSSIWTRLRAKRFTIVKRFSIFVGILQIASISLFCWYDKASPDTFGEPRWYYVCYVFRVAAGCFSIYTAFMICLSGREDKGIHRLLSSIQLSVYILIIACTAFEDPVFTYILDGNDSGSLAKACKILPSAYLIVALVYILVYLFSNCKGRSGQKESIQANDDVESQDGDYDQGKIVGDHMFTDEYMPR